MKTVLFAASAKLDLAEGAGFYDRQEAGLGAYFDSSLMADIEELATLHGLHPRRAGMFKMLATKFPHGIYYHDLDDSVLVVAILDLRRNPAWLRAQLKTRTERESS